MSSVFQKHSGKYLLASKSEIFEELPSDVYTVQNTREGVFFTPLKIQKDSLIRVPNSITDEVVSFIENFTKQETKERYKQCKITHKTAVLLHGTAGSGKSGTLNLIIDDIVRTGGIVLFDTDPKLVAAILPALREQNPEKLICVVYEEFDEWLQSSQSTINSFLDGQLSVNNMVVLATTNYLSRIPSRIKNRPSRFQLVKEIGVPSAEFRQEWLSRKLEEIGQSDKLAEMVQVSDGMVVDQMKDLIVSHIALQIPLHEVVKKLQDMSSNAAGMDDYNDFETQKHINASNERFKLEKVFKALSVPNIVSLSSQNEPEEPTDW
jgi:SpoVK/Ycf46/Vps4 family AAA+-type ATPase